jgi:putative dehydrogenase
MSDSGQPIVALIGAGEMGAAVGRRLKRRGARVLISLEGRGPESERRVRRAEIEVVDDDAAVVRDADFVLSIVPPGVAVEIARRYRGALNAAVKNPIFADCNAISPATARRIGEILAGCRCRYVDAGIIGGPPPEDLNAAGPRFYASGGDAREFANLARFGLDIAVLDGPIGAASGLKLSYAGLTKGITALGAAMIAAASREGLADALRSELARSQPQILGRLARQVPAMFPKAYRWVAEMREIAEFLDGDDRGAMIYEGAARLYDRIAAENEADDSADDIRALADFCAAAIDSARK